MLTFVATIAGAMTKPIKARAIKRSYIEILPVRLPGLLRIQWAGASTAKWLFLREEAASSADPKLHRNWRTALQPIHRNHRQDERNL
jgi:hypothetical protein